jgi:transposase-like protein
MKNQEFHPKTLLEAVTYFSDLQVCVEYMKRHFWSNGMVCSRCQSSDLRVIATRQLWQCKDCRKQFSIKVGTIFEGSKISITKWLPALWLLTNSKNGISSYEVSRALGVTQKTAWFMMHRIRETMKVRTGSKLAGIVEADETYVGGLEKNKHGSKKVHAGVRGVKSVVMGMVERGGDVVSKVIDSPSQEVLNRELEHHVELNSTLITDEWRGYDRVHQDFNHAKVNHSAKEYVNGMLHTNSIEGYWSLFKRSYKGTYIHMLEFHLNRYLDEQNFRYNFRKSDDAGRFQELLTRAVGQRLTWEQLVHGTKSNG